MTTNTMTLEGPLAVLREEEITLLNDLAASLNILSPDESEDDRRRLRDVAKDLGEMFFLVAVIGEFNAGKSTFINALLGEALLPMGITPTTEAIELIRYNENAQRKPLLSDDGRLRQWAHPNTGAEGVAIVDTPGTGSVFERHDTVAKDFLHRSDLVIFLISAKRAFADTERIYLDLARSYGKKALIVMNQVDLLDPVELKQVRKFVEQQVKETLGFEPLILPVSAKLALNGEGGGIEAVRAHLRGVFAEAPPTKQKLLSQLGLAEQTTKRYLERITSDETILQKDTTRVKDVQEELDKHALGLTAQLKEANAEISKILEDLRKRGHTFISQNLSVGQILRRPQRDKLQAEFTDIVIGQALRDIDMAAEGYINEVVDSSRLYWRSVIDRLNQLMESMAQDVSGLDASAYAEQRESLEEAIRIAKAELESYSTGRAVGEMQDIFETNMNAFTFSMVTAIGALVAIVLAAAAPGAALAGGSLIVIGVAAPFALAGGMAAFRYYQRVQRDLHQDLDKRVDQLAKSYSKALDDLTERERQRLRRYGRQVLTPIFELLEVRASRFREQHEQLNKHLTEAKRLREAIEKADA